MPSYYAWASFWVQEGTRASLNRGMMLSHFAFGKRGTLKSAPAMQEQESEATADMSICRFEQEVRDTTISMEHDMAKQELLGSRDISGAELA